ncbi:MAG: ATP synthase F1 subunit gamma [Candidatus Cloacimonadales bacterium]|jgi:F-type H+-transporting ATPase subunit gamma|nr:ATP synthase F1 subunit gamma [Candidatus Cloacimonadota bacterium]MDD2650144.1 ATP synthase F1 subunit gamma [Candidatus Cloacimonadota bacterium]MDD3501207.1 ATP synthase F1 subunit gamma [Candidatus Cloacimonadota bacterium]MDX9977416.1 ATP synthase F1 subunit gamma [Candidatus Cloacimonadales bacterium]
MANLRDLRTRIDSIKNTKQITNAMKMVAAAKLRKSQDLCINSRPYADYVERVLFLLQQKNNTKTHPMLNTPNPNGKILLVVVTGDRGLCGSFNSSIIRYTNQYMKDNNDKVYDLLCIGRKAYDAFKRSGKVVQHFTNISENTDIDNIYPVKNAVLTMYSSGEYSKVEIVYNEFKSAIQQELQCKQLLPIASTESESEHYVDFLYEPDEETLIEELCTKYINVELWHIMLESNAAEQAARMTAMDNATNNATELIDQLSLLYNRMRQAQITTEIIEVASGAEAIQQ